jgi:surface protein
MKKEGNKEVNKEVNKEGNKEGIKGYLNNEISKIPNDQYACTKENCKLVPEITNINYELGIIYIKCPTHGDLNMNIKDYFKQESKNVYYNSVCKFSDLEQKKYLSSNKIFSYNCKNNQVYCFNCMKDQKKNAQKSLFIKVTEINDKCHEHLKNNEKYCSKCKKHFCNDKNCICEHSKDIEEIKKANKDDINRIKDKKNELIKIIELQEYLIKLLDTLIETYEKHPHNYFNTININNVSKKINELPKKPLVQVKPNNKNKEIIEHKLTVLEDKILKFLNQKLKISLNGKEKIIDLNNKGIGTIELELLTGVKFVNLEELHLKDNNIDKLDSLKDLYSPKLKKLDLSNNKINDIKPLKDDVLKPKLFPNIMEIKLENNNILLEEIEEIKKLLNRDYIKECELEYELNKNKNEIRIFGEDFVHKNKENCKIIIDEKGKEKEISEFYKIENGKKNKITIKLKINENIEDITGIFTNCENLISVNSIFSINSLNINDLSDLFSGCSSLKSLPNSLSEWDTSNITNMSGVFYGCKSLENLPDISKWDTSNVTNMMSMFNGCSSLIDLPDISKWNISQTENISCMFNNCSSLRQIPNISSWKTGNVTNMGDLFCGCSKIKDLKCLTNWKTTNVTIMKNMFKGCTSLITRPDIEKWDMKKVTNKNDMFKKCP